MPSQKKRPVTLTPQDREDLVQITTTGVHGASQIMRARVLLALDTSVGTVDDEVVIAVRVGVSRETIRLVAKRDDRLEDGRGSVQVGAARGWWSTLVS